MIPYRHEIEATCQCKETSSHTKLQETKPAGHTATQQICNEAIEKHMTTEIVLEHNQSLQLKEQVTCSSLQY